MNIEGLTKDSLTVLAISISILACGEIILRTVADEPEPEAVAYEFNEDYLFALKPNVSKEYTRAEENGGDVIRWQTNSNSFRGDELRDGGGYRIMVYGDSNIQARFSTNDNTFSSQLSRQLHRSGLVDAEVVNAGVIGAGPDQNLIRLRKEIDLFKPDLIVFHVFADNDFGDLLRNRLFDLDADGQLVESGHPLTMDDALSPPAESFISSLRIIDSSRKMIRSLPNITPRDREVEAEEDIKKLQSQVAEEYLIYAESKPREKSVLADHYDLDLAIDPEQDSSKVKMRLMDGVLMEASRVALDKGSRFLVLIQPAVMDMTRENKAIGYEHLQKFSGYKRTNLSDAVANICVSHSISYINLFELFDTNSPEGLFFIDDDHWNDNGQSLAAAEVARYITENTLL